MLQQYKKLLQLIEEHKYSFLCTISERFTPALKEDLKYRLITMPEKEYKKTNIYICGKRSYSEYYGNPIFLRISFWNAGDKSRIEFVKNIIKELEANQPCT